MRNRRLLLPAALALLAAWPATAAAVDPTGELTRTDGNGLKATLTNNDEREIHELGLAPRETSIADEPPPSVTVFAAEARSTRQAPSCQNFVLFLACNLIWQGSARVEVNFATTSRMPDDAGAVLAGCFAPCAGPADFFENVVIGGPRASGSPQPTPPPPLPLPPTGPPPAVLPEDPGADMLSSLFALRPEEVDDDRHPARPPVAALDFDLVTANVGPRGATNAQTTLDVLALPEDADILLPLPPADEGPSMSRCRTIALPEGLDPLFCAYGEMAPGEPEREELSVELDDDAGLIRLRSRATADPFDPQLGNNVSEISVFVSDIPDSRVRVLRLVGGRIVIESLGTAPEPDARPRAARAAQAPPASGSVQVAVGRVVGKRSRRSCVWETGARGRRTVRRSCDDPNWIDARRAKRSRRKAKSSSRDDTESWVARLRRLATCGRYLVLTRAIGPSGAYEARFTRKDGNRRVVRLKGRRCR